VADETNELVSITLTTEDWARLRECLATLTGYAEDYARQAVETLERRRREDSSPDDRVAWQRDLQTYVTLAHDAKRLKHAVGRRVDARMGKA
jgi:hypothetical protein